MPFLLASSDLVLTLAERVARHFTQLLPVARFTPPIALPTITTGFYWHERDAHDPGLTWLRGELCALRKALRR
jgi:DNA-binding transcriptional LysR family regulator